MVNIYLQVNQELIQIISKNNDSFFSQLFGTLIFNEKLLDELFRIICLMAYQHSMGYLMSKFELLLNVYHSYGIFNVPLHFFKQLLLICR